MGSKAEQPQKGPHPHKHGGCVRGGAYEPRVQLWALQREVSTPCSRSPGGLWPVGKWDGSNVGFIFNWTSGEKHREKGMHKPAAHTRRTPNASQAALLRSCVHITVPFWCCCCRPRSQQHHCHRPTPVPVPDSVGRGHNPTVPPAQPQAHAHHTPAKTHRGYKLDRSSNCGAFCSSLHLWTISPPLKCFTLFITFHLTPATSSK